MKKYYAMEVVDRAADIYIFGDIETPLWKSVSENWYGDESTVSGLSLITEIKDLDVDVINVHINSYGGHVSEGLAIHNSLVGHKAKIRTICDGFACSAASVVFMSGDERLMNAASLLMVHNAWAWGEGNASDLRKQADDLEVITNATKQAFLKKINISEERLTELYDAESWISPEDALEMGFATAIIQTDRTEKVSANVRTAVFQSILAAEPESDVELVKMSVLAAKEIEAANQPAIPENKIKNFLNALVGGKESK